MVRGMVRHFIPVIGLLLGAAIAAQLQAGDIPVPNASFELPKTGYASPGIDSWQKSPRPDSYPGNDEQWITVSGVFTNIAPGSADVVRPWVEALRNVGFAVFARSVMAGSAITIPT